MNTRRPFVDDATVSTAMRASSMPPSVRGLATSSFGTATSQITMWMGSPNRAPTRCVHRCRGAPHRCACSASAAWGHAWLGPIPGLPGHPQSAGGIRIGTRTRASRDYGGRPGWAQAVEGRGTQGDYRRWPDPPSVVTREGRAPVQGVLDSPGLGRLRFRCREIRTFSGRRRSVRAERRSSVRPGRWRLRRR